MPQLDTLNFFTQSFWLFLTLEIFYMFLLYFVIVPYTEALKFRKKLLKKRTHKALNLYDKYLETFFKK